MQVWRLESSGGKGVYNVMAPHTTKDGSFPIDERHPCPTEDYGLKDFWAELSYHGNRDGWIFGFESIESYHAWFYTKRFVKLLTVVKFCWCVMMLTT